MNFIMIYPFYLKDGKWSSWINYTHIKFIKALHHWFAFKKVHRVVKFNQNTWLKPYWYEHKSKKKKTKIYFEKNFLSWWIMQFLEKLLRKHRYVKLAAAETKTIYLGSELNY